MPEVPGGRASGAAGNVGLAESAAEIRIAIVGAAAGAPECLLPIFKKRTDCGQQRRTRVIDPRAGQSLRGELPKDGS